jgi:heme A synthase
MTDRGILFVFSLLMVVVGLAASGWLVVSGQAATVDGLFLLLTCLLVAAAFALYLMFMINRAKQSLQPAAPAKAAASTPKAAPKASTSSHPVETS